MDFSLKNSSSTEITLSTVTLSGYCYGKQYWKAAEISQHPTGYRIVSVLLSIPVLGLLFTLIERICTLIRHCCFKEEESKTKPDTKKPLAKKPVAVKHSRSSSSSSSSASSNSSGSSSSSSSTSEECSSLGQKVEKNRREKIASKKRRERIKEWRSHVEQPTEREDPSLNRPIEWGDPQPDFQKPKWTAYDAHLDEDLSLGRAPNPPFIEQPLDEDDYQNWLSEIAKQARENPAPLNNEDNAYLKWQRHLDYESDNGDDTSSSESLPSLGLVEHQSQRAPNSDSVPPPA